MAGKISELTETTTPTTTMQFEVNDGGTSKRITHANVFNGVASADINGGTIDGTAVGASSASTGAFTTLSSSSTTTLGMANGTTITLGGSTVCNVNLASTSTFLKSATEIMFQILSGRQFVFHGSTSITASSTQSQGQQELSDLFNVVTTVGTTNDVVTLPTAVQGLAIFILNAGANTLQVYPNTSDAIGAGSANASTTQTTKTGKLYIAADATTWIVF